MEIVKERGLVAMRSQEVTECYKKVQETKDRRWIRDFGRQIANTNFKV